MADHTITIRSTYFRVTDEAELRKVLDACEAADDIEVLSYTPVGGPEKFAFGCYGRIYGYEIATDEKPVVSDSEMVEAFYKGLQTVLPADEAVIVLEVGNDGLSNVYGVCTIITAQAIQYADVMTLAELQARAMLCDPGFEVDI